MIGTVFLTILIFWIRAVIKNRSDILYTRLIGRQNRQDGLNLITTLYTLYTFSHNLFVLVRIYIYI